MLPTQELFRSIPCPYYVAGLCERPHCFFRHTKSDILLARKVEQGLLLEDGSYSDEDEESTRSNNNGTSKQDERLNSISNKVSAAATHSKASVNTPNLNFDELRKRPAVDALEGVKKKIRLALENIPEDLKNKDHVEKDLDVKSSPRLLREFSPGGQNIILKDTEINSDPSNNRNSIKDTSINEPQIASNLDEKVLIHDKSNPKEISSRKKSSHSSHTGSSHVRKSSSSSSSKSSSKHNSSSKDSKKEISSKKDEKKNSSRHSNSTNSKERSHKTSSNSNGHSHSHRSSSNSNNNEIGRTSHKKVSNTNNSSNSCSSNSSSSSKEYKKDTRDRKNTHYRKTKTAPSATIATTSNTEKSDAKLDLDVEILDDLDYSGRFGNSDEFRFPDASDYEDDPDDIAMECLKMFEDYKPTEENQVASMKNSNDTNSDLSLKFNDNTPSAAMNEIGKRRMAHPGAWSLPPPFPKITNRLPSQNLMKTIGSRLESQRKNTDEEDLPATVATSLPSSPSAGNKKRIAHVRNVSGLLRPTSVSAVSSSGNANPEGYFPQSRDKPPFSGITDVHPNKPLGTTVAQTATKGQSRCAHLPSKSVQASKRPMIILDSPNKSTKIPNAIRQRVLDQIYDTCAKLYDNTLAFSTAVKEENKIALRCVAKPVYLSLSVATVTRLRRELQEMQSDIANGNTSAVGSGVANQTVSHDRNLTGAGAANCSIQKSNRNDKFPEGNELYKSLTKYVLSEEELVKNGFPRPHPSGDAGRAEAQSRYSDESYIHDDVRRSCQRCKKVYEVGADGTQSFPDSCTHHSGRKNRHKVGRAWKTLYTCCGEESGALGCVTLTYHVPNACPISLCRGFVSCVQDAGDDNLMGNNEWDIVAIDCEMVSTTGGSELARATFVGKDKKVIYDKLVIPSHPILDYNTQFSGLTEEDMKKATATLNDVQAAMLTQLKPNSILIGHSLESDLIALKFKHDCVIDTSVLFPHRNGHPQKRALRNLTSEHLAKIIQNSEAGHDSAEDAIAALSLVYHKLNQDNKSKDYSTTTANAASVTASNEN